MSCYVKATKKTMRKQPIEHKNILLNQTQFELKVIRSKRRKKTLALSMHSALQLTMQVPFHTSVQSIDNFLQEHSAWILRRHTTLSHQEKEKPSSQFQNGDVIHYLGHPCRLQINMLEHGDNHCRIQDNDLQVFVKSSLQKTEIQQKIRDVISKWLWQQAQEKIPQRVIWWSNHLQLSYNKLLLSRAKKRWGSCTAQNVIRINWVLIMTPPELLDYVIVHELCHIKHKNHSAKFWSLVKSFLPDYKMRRQALYEWERWLRWY